MSNIIPTPVSYGTQVDFQADVNLAPGFESVRALYQEPLNLLSVFDVKTGAYIASVSNPPQSDSAPSVIIPNAAIEGQAGMGDVNIYLKTDGSLYVGFDGYPVPASAPATYGGGSGVPPRTTGGTYDPPEIKVASSN